MTTDELRGFTDELEKLGSFPHSMDIRDILSRGWKHYASHRQTQKKFTRLYNQALREGFQGSYNKFVSEVGEDKLLELINSKSDKAVNKMVKKIDNEINPPFWKTNLGKIGIGAAAIGSGVYLYNKGRKSVTEAPFQNYIITPDINTSISPSPDTNTSYAK